LSNLASLLGLLAYPVVVEPFVTLRQQSLGWSTAYAVFAALGIAAAFAGRGQRTPDGSPSPQDPVTNADRPPKLREQVLWLLLAGCASTLLLAVTNHLTQNVASIPFLWVLPLSLYLVTFVLTFDYERLYNRKVFLWLMVLTLAGMSYGLTKWDSHTSLKLVVPAFCAGLFICCMFCHGELVKRKPSPRYLTSFYLMLSLGGALGGLLVGLVAPRVLPAYFELPIALAACSLILLVAIDYRTQRLIVAVGWTTATAVLLTAGYYMSSYGQSVRVMSRNFYGGLRVQEYDRGTDDETRVLVHGTVTHGMQYTQPSRRSEALSYYGPGSGVSLALAHLRHASLRVGVIGLGAGSLAAYARPGDVFRFYEINPLVEKLARSEFTFLADCSGKVDVVLGDGRLSLEREPAQRYDLLVVDAFSGDAIPVHLLTKEALELYFGHLKPAGILALHITNTHLDLEPVVEKLAGTLDKRALLVSTDADESRNIYRSKWALLSQTALASPALQEAAEDLADRPGLRVWTDEYNNLIQILK
jgi:hypothetical protein